MGLFYNYACLLASNAKMTFLSMKILEKRVSKINGQIVVARSLGLGTYIQVEGLTQSGGVVESIWKSTLKKINHKPLTINHCLILGLGGGTAAKVIKKLWPEAEITGVEIDPIMTELGSRYLELGASDAKIVIGDAEKIGKRLKVRGKSFDLILIDTYLGDQFPTRFESEAFFKLILKLLASSGTVVFNRLYYGEKRPEAVRFGEKLKKVFPKVQYYYPQANLMLIASF